MPTNKQRAGGTGFPSAPETDTATRRPDSPSKRVRPNDNESRAEKSLLDRFTNDDAVIGEPVSRWLTCAGRVPGAQDSIDAGQISARSGHKTNAKPAKSGNGRISPRHPRMRAEHCSVVLVSGELLLTQTDFELAGPLPLSWRRTYRTGHNKDFGLGWSWTSMLLSRLDLRENEAVYCDDTGREIPFDRLAPGQSCVNPLEQLRLHCDDATLYRIIRPDQSVLTFGGTGKRRQLYEVADRQGHAIKLFYSANDRLIQILDSSGRRLRLDYNVSGQMYRIFLCDAQGEITGKPLVEYAYNDDRDLVRIMDANGNSQAFEYRYHLITKHTNKDGFNLHFEWDEYTIKGKCTRQWGDHDIYEYRFKYDEANKITRSADARGHTTEYHYNDLGLITTEIDPEGGVSQFSYSAEARLFSERGPTGGTTYYHYDNNGLLIGRTNAQGAAYRYEYDADANLIKCTDPQERNWERQYDARGLLTASKDPLGNITSYEYNAAGLLIALTNPLGHTRRYEWNDKAELLWHSDATGHKVHHTHDTLGRLVKTSAGDQHSAHYSYDRMGFVTQVILPGGASEQLHHTALGNLTQYIDAVGRSTRYKYEGLNQPVEKTDPSGRHVRFEYDKLRNLTALVNENGERYELEYDKNQRLIRETGFDGRTQQYNYDAAGLRVRHLDGAHRVTSCKRDAMGRVVQTRTSTGEITQYEYDTAQLLIKAVNKTCELQFRYDALGQLFGEQQNSQRLHHRYDAAGQKTHTILPNGKTVRFDYDARGLLARVAYSGRVLCKLSHDRFGLEEGRTTGEIRSKFEYDPMGRMIAQHSANSSVTIVERRYRYDKAGNLRQIDDCHDGRTKLHYDTLDRVEQVEGACEERFTYDPAGNLLDSQYPEPAGFVQGNRLRVFQNYRFEYDDVGNLVRQFQGKLETRLYYNVANQLVRVQKNAQTYEYAYDPLGRRIKKLDPTGETRYVWDGDLLLQELRGESVITYIYDPARRIPLCQIRNDEVFYFHTDREGTPVIITSPDGEILWKAQYKAFGGIANLQERAFDNALRFRGWYHDPETGFLYSGGHYYHPVIGRWVQQLPGTPHGANAYLYRPGTSDRAGFARAISPPRGSATLNDPAPRASTRVRRCSDILSSDLASARPWWREFS